MAKRKKQNKKRKPLKVVDYDQNAINEENYHKIVKALEKASKKYNTPIEYRLCANDMLSVKVNGKCWLMVVNEINGRIYRKDHNDSNGTKMHFHDDRSFSNWFQASESLVTTHNPKYWKNSDTYSDWHITNNK